MLLSVIGVFELVPSSAHPVGDPGGAARRDRRKVADHRGLLLYFLVNRSRTPSSSRRSRAMPSSSGRCLRDHHRQLTGRVAGRDLALPVTAAFRDVVRYLFRRSRTPRRSRLTVEHRDGSRRCLTGRPAVLRVDPRPRTSHPGPYRRLARKYHPGDTPGAARGVDQRGGEDGDRLLRRTSAGDDFGEGGVGDVPPRRHRPRGFDSTTRPPDVVSRDWTSAGPPPVQDSTSRCARPRVTARRGRHRDVLGDGAQLGAGWSLGEVARHDIEYIEWLDRAPIGRNYRPELDAILRSTGRRRSADGDASNDRGLYRRR